MAEFLQVTEQKVNYLNKNFLIFQQDINKPFFEQETDFDNPKNIEKLIVLTNYKEELLKSRCTSNLLKELMTLYQKVFFLFVNCKIRL